MKIIIIAAVGINYEIGFESKLIWKISEDLNFFKETTTNGIIVMGEKTYYSIGRALPNRTNLILSTSLKSDEKITVFDNINNLMNHLRLINAEKVYICGGESIYRQFIDIAEEIILTEIDSTVQEADTFFPTFNKSKYNANLLGEYENQVKYKRVSYISKKQPNYPIILDGKYFSNIRTEEMKKEILELTNTYQKSPCLAVVLVGDNSSSVTYVKMKERKAKDIGIKVLHHHLSAESTTKEVLNLIDELNSNPEVNGIIIQHPLPKQVDENQCFRRLSLEKDVDGLNPTNLGLLTIKENTFFSATPKGIVDLLHFYNFKLDGLHAVVVGRSQILGKPISLMLLNENATVTICHSKTVNLNRILKTADIIVAALGKAKFIEARSVKPGAILIDAGYNEGNVGDIDLEKAIFKAIAYTPVPGGIGPTTIISLLSQTILAFKNQVKGNF